MPFLSNTETLGQAFNEKLKSWNCNPQTVQAYAMTEQIGTQITN